MKNNLIVLLSLCMSLKMVSQVSTNDQPAYQEFLSSKTTPVYKGYKNTMGSIYANEAFQSGSVFKVGN